uniref:von Willebrand factor A domain containing 5B2 n=1 Tax=Seriola lalandi dorsalis TaxID=1841481 RepID=A0A3B4XSJ4_SERLL
LFTAVPPEDPPPGQCRSRIHGLLSGRPVSWEVTVDLGAQTHLLICVYMVLNQVRLQLASGAFLLTEMYSDCVQIPLDRLKRPLGAPSSHHVTFSPSSDDTPLIQSHGQADSGRGSETDVYEGSTVEPADLQGSCLLAQEDLEGSSWATAVALAWLEHRCAGYFMEWELVAAKADFWLRCQELPEGVDLAGLKGAARQLFLLLRHWDENIKLNMLCYNPNNM